MIQRHTVVAVLLILLGLALVPGALAQQPKRSPPTGATWPTPS